MKRITQVFKDLMTPDDQSQSWYGWATNQLSHAFLGAVVALFAGAYWFVVVIALAAIKEAFDLFKVFNRRALLDSLVDISFWLLGAGIVVSEEYKLWIIGAFLLLISVGVYPRIRK